MGTLGIILLTICGIAAVIWVGLACMFCWSGWAGRHQRNARLAKAYEKAGQEFHPVGDGRVAWMLLSSFPGMLFFSGLWMLLILYYLIAFPPLLIWCRLTGKPLPHPRFPDRPPSPPPSCPPSCPP